MNNEYIRITLGDGNWSFWDYVKAVAVVTPILILITVVAVLPPLCGGGGQ